ncbi:MAG TPA: stage 0 sporulation family protein [Bacilli bacterium]|nr:stage 0 sporulation family protein [Bacilli bacterium]
MVTVVGVQFKNVGKIYWFNPASFDLKPNDLVVVDTIRGIELGQVVGEIQEISEDALEHELKNVIRIATEEDIQQYQINLEQAKIALVKCKEIVKQHGLEMKLLDCEYTLDKQKLIFYYNADGRVDFRELLKTLAAEFRVRIELRQVGPREGAKFLGGIGCCGRVVCCKSHLREFNLVTMKMAKDQGMALNASKVAGLCGKLMCCIAYENELYQEKKQRLPSVGDLVKTPTCEACKVVAVNYLRELITVEHDDVQVVWSSDEIEGITHKEEEVIDPKDLTDDIFEDDEY